MLQNNQVTHYETNLLKDSAIIRNFMWKHTLHHDIFLEDHVSAAKFEIERKSSIDACIGMMKLENFRYVNGQFQGEKKNSKGNWQWSNLHTSIPRFFYFSISFVIALSLSRLGNERFDSPRLLRVTSSKNFVDALSKPRYDR